MNLDCDTVLYKIGLVVRENRTLSSGLNLFLLFRGRKFHRLSDELCIFRHPLRRALFFPVPAAKLAHHDLFMAMGEQNTVLRLRFSFQTLLLCRRIDGGNYLFNFRPWRRFVDFDEFPSVLMRMERGNFHR